MNFENQKLLLASEISSVISKLSELAKIDPSNTKVAFIQNAAVPYGDPNEIPWVTADKLAFTDVGYHLETVEIENFLSIQELRNKISEFDIIHVCGGNTLYLNYLFHKTGLFEICKDLVESGKLIYTGTSAGSMIVSPDLFEIKDSLLEDIDQKYLEGISRDGYYGLSLVPFLIIPHVQNPDYQEDNIKTIKKLSSYPHPLIFLQDGQAVWVQGDNYKFI